jgi:hypothetical protein
MKTTLLILKNISLFFLAPFIALAYLFALPVVAFYATTKCLIDLATAKKEVKETTLETAEI